MDRIGVVGVSWRTGGTEALERFTIALARQEKRLPEMVREVGVNGLVYLCTCNRVELAFESATGVDMAEYRRRFFQLLAGYAPAPGEAERTFRAWVGEGAIEHLFLVASGLDSARIGETDIHGQVRDALERARDSGMVSPSLDLVLEESLRVARQVRNTTALGRGRLSLAEIGRYFAERRLRETPGTLAVVGVSSMTERCARSLSGVAERILVVNRTESRAQALAVALDGEHRSLEQFGASPDPVEVVICSTGATAPVLRGRALERLASCSASGRPPLIVDLAIPPDVDPAEADAAGIARIGMDEINAEAQARRAERAEEASEARALIDDALSRFCDRLTEGALAPKLAAIQSRYRTAAIESAERLLKKELSGLAEAERESLRRWAESLGRRLAHLPSSGLRSLAFEHGMSAVDSFLERADDALTKEIAEATREWEQRGRLVRGRDSKEDGGGKR